MNLLVLIGADDWDNYVGLNQQHDNLVIHVVTIDCGFSEERLKELRRENRLYLEPFSNYYRRMGEHNYRQYERIIYLSVTAFYETIPCPDLEDRKCLFFDLGHSYSIKVHYLTFLLFQSTAQMWPKFNLGKQIAVLKQSIGPNQCLLKHNLLAVKLLELQEENQAVFRWPIIQQSFELAIDELKSKIDWPFLKTLNAHSITLDDIKAFIETREIPQSRTQPSFDMGRYSFWRDEQFLRTMRELVRHDLYPAKVDGVFIVKIGGDSAQSEQCGEEEEAVGGGIDYRYKYLKYRHKYLSLLELL